MLIHHALPMPAAISMRAILSNSSGLTRWWTACSNNAAETTALLTTGMGSFLRHHGQARVASSFADDVGDLVSPCLIAKADKLVRTDDACHKPSFKTEVANSRRNRHSSTRKWGSPSMYLYSRLISVSGMTAGPRSCPESQRHWAQSTFWLMALMHQKSYDGLQYRSQGRECSGGTGFLRARVGRRSVGSAIKPPC
jgi:hypothetical protein